MQIYNSITGKIETLPETILVNKVNKYTDKMIESELNSVGYYKIATVANPIIIPNHQRVEEQDGVIIDNLYTKERILVDLPIEELRTKLKNQLKVKSKEVEIQGITVGGIEVETTRDSQSLLNGAYAHAGRNPTQNFSFPGKSGWATVNKVEIDAINDAVGNHVRATFDNEMAHDEILDDAGLATLQAYDINTGW